MLRVGELVLIVAPFAAILLLYVVVVRGSRVPRRLVFALMVAVMGLGAWLTWEGTSDGLDPGARYVPAMLRNGTIVQGHGG